MSVSLSFAQNIMMTYLSLHLITNITLELVYVRKCTSMHYFKWNNQNFMGRGHGPLPKPLPIGEGTPFPPRHPSPRRLRRLDSRDFGARPPSLLFWQIEHWCRPYKWLTIWYSKIGLSNICYTVIIGVWCTLWTWSLSSKNSFSQRSAARQRNR